MKYYLDKDGLAYLFERIDERYAAGITYGYLGMTHPETGSELVKLTMHLQNSENSTLSSFDFPTATETGLGLMTASQVRRLNSLENYDDTQLVEDISDIKGYMGYFDPDIAGLEVDYKNSVFTRLSGAAGLSAGEDFDRFSMYGGRKRCNVSDNGTINAYFGDESYADDGSNGQVMVYQPKFYYKVVPINYERNADSGLGYHLRKAAYYVSDVQKPGFKLHPAFCNELGNEVDYILLSAYEGSMYDASAAAYVNDSTAFEADTSEDIICSVANVKPVSLVGAVSRTDYRTMINNRGIGWHLETVKAASANQLLMMIELGTMNTQSAIGEGIVSITDNSAYNCSGLTGSTAALGNTTGQAAESISDIAGEQTAYTQSGRTAVSYRGYENPYGNIRTMLDGITVFGNSAMCGGQPYIADNFAFAENKIDGNYKAAGFTLPNASGYIKAMGYGDEKYDWLLMPSENGGTSAAPVGDYSTVMANLNNYRVVEIGGMWSNTDRAGAFSTNVTYSYTTTGARAVGGRIMYVPQ